VPRNDEKISEHVETHNGEDGPTLEFSMNTYKLAAI